MSLPTTRPPTHIRDHARKGCDHECMADFASAQNGKSIRLRRRPAAAAGAVAFVVAVLAVYLALTRWQYPLAVTDVAAPGPAQDLVASGKVGNASWQIIVKPSPYVQQPGQVCWFGQ